MSEVKNIVKRITRKSFFDYFFKKKLNELATEHVLLDRLFSEERKTASIMGGLQTSLGTQLWEALATELAKENNFTVKDPKEIQQATSIPIQLTNTITEWRVRREQSNANLALSGFLDKLKEDYRNPAAHDVTYSPITKGEGADLLLEKDGCEYAFDIKTVQINAGTGVKLNHTLMKWYAYRIYQKGAINFEARIVFPYNPHKGHDWWAKEGKKAYPLDKNDVFVEGEFWDCQTAWKNGQGIRENSVKVDHVKSLTCCSNTHERIKTNAEDGQC